jgi:hypothetical protein
MEQAARMPWWTRLHDAPAGRAVAPDERDSPASFDGRYFGPTERRHHRKGDTRAVAPLRPLRFRRWRCSRRLARPCRSVDRWRPYIDEASGAVRCPGDWIERVMRAESGGRTMLDGRPITSRAGAMGLMQLMPGTWAEMRARSGSGRSARSARQYPRRHLLSADDV